jgi:hypothetical protein
MKEQKRKEAANAAAQKGKMTYCTPRSPVLKTSMRFRPKQANISLTQLADSF